MKIPTADSDIHAVLGRYWGHAGFRPKQEEIIRSVMSGKDTLALLPTGGGKSVCFQVPALAMGRMCLVVSPLIALMRDQVQRLTGMGISAKAITSTMSRQEIDVALDNAAVGRYSFLYVSPERLSSDVFQARVERMAPGLIAVDEAHCISQWGYDFRPSYMKIMELREKLPNVPVLALTASATEQVAADIMAKLAFPVPHIIRGSFSRPELVLWVSHGEDKHGRLLKVMQKLPGSSIVYVRERRSTIRVAGFLQHHGISAEAYHAGLPSEQRDRIQQQWTAGTLRCVVATNAFGMGIDKADVRSVLHMAPPNDLESYYQEAGRGGRDGSTAHAFLLMGPGDEEALHERVARSFPAVEEVRQVYQSFADIHGIAMGSGMMETYDLDLQQLALRSGTAPIVVAHALKVLELDGKIALTEGVRTPSRVLLLADQRVVYQLRVSDTRMAPLLEALLRMYGGLYEEAVVIDEARLAKAANYPVDKVTKLLTALHQQRVLSYKPRSDAPRITLLTPRQDAKRMSLDPHALKDRELRAVQRLNAMIDYTRRERCRARMLMEHFGEVTTTDCGRCDHCVRKAQDTSRRDQPHDQASPLDRANDPDVRWELDQHG